MNAARKIAALLDIYSPTVVVVRQRRYLSPEADKAVLAVTVSVMAETRRRSIKFRTQSTRKVQRFFAQYGCTTKFQIASILVEWFEELAWKLPPKRRPWQSESHSMAIFDAVAEAVSFLGGPGTAKKDLVD